MFSWEKSAKDRPTFLNLVDRLKEMQLPTEGDKKPTEGQKPANQPPTATLASKYVG